jgi:hypothetical protein
VTRSEAAAVTLLANVSSVMIYSREEEIDKQELVGEDSDPGGEIKPEKQAHFTDFECKVEK